MTVVPSIQDREKPRSFKELRGFVFLVGSILRTQLFPIFRIAALQRTKENHIKCTNIGALMKSGNHISKRCCISPLESRTEL